MKKLEIRIYSTADKLPNSGELVLFQRVGNDLPRLGRFVDDGRLPHFDWNGIPIYATEKIEWCYLPNLIEAKK